MGLTDFVSRITSVYKADTTQHRAAIKQLSGDQKKAAQEELKRIEASNDGIESQIKKYAKIGVALGSVAIAGKLAFDAIEFAGRRADLRGAAGTVSIDRLRKATLGLRTETQLLETAAKLNNTALGLSQDQMDIAARAAQSLAERGGDAQEAFDAVTAALVSGKTKGLAPYGIAIDETKDKSVKLAEIMKALTEESGKLTEANLDGADKMGIAQNKLTNALDEIKVGVGELAMSLTPLIEGLAIAASKTADLFNSVRTGWSGMFAMMGGRDNFLKFWGYDKNDFNGKTDGSALENYIAGGGDEASFIASHQSRNLPGSDSQSGLGGYGSKDNSLAEALAKQAARDKERKAKGLDPLGGRGGGRSGPTDYERYIADQARAYQGSIEAADALQDALIQAGFASESQTELADRLRGEFDQASGDGKVSRSGGTGKYDLSQSDGGKAAEAYAAFRARGGGKSMLEEMVGTPEDVDIAKQTFATLTDAMGAGFEAIVNGSESAGTAIKKMIGTGMMATAKQLFVEGVKHQVLAIGSLASEDVKGFALHQTAAAKSFAGAVIVGGIGAALGGTGSGAGAGRVTPSIPYKGGVSSYAGGSNVTIVYGDQFADDSPRNRQRTAQKLVGKALGTSGGTYS